MNFIVIFFLSMAAAACSNSEPVISRIEVVRPLLLVPRCEIWREDGKEVLDFIVQFDDTIFATHCALQTSIPICAVVQFASISAVSENGVVSHSNFANSSIYFLKSKNNVYRLSHNWTSGDETIVVNMNFKKVFYYWVSKEDPMRVRDFSCPQ